mgnify:CR=1 FL=1
MSDSITYMGEMLGSVHYDVYKNGKLPGRPEDLFLRFRTHDSLDKLLNLALGEVVIVGDEKMTVGSFRDEILEKCPYLYRI